MTERETLPVWTAAWWRPITSAPRDGSDFLALLGTSDDMMVVYYADPPDDCPTHCWHRMDGMAYHQDLPTHWMPLPPVPMRADGERTSKED